MFYNDNLREDIDIDIVNNNQNFNTNTMEQMNYNNMSTMNNSNFNMDMPMGDVMSPVIEPGRERVINRTFVHEVPHICPINTRIINNHIYKHTYQPRYTCCEENRVCQEQCGSCCCFR